MAKTKSFDNPVIHPNRYLIWTIAIAVIMTISLVAFMRISDINFDAESNTHTLNVQYHHAK